LKTELKKGLLPLVWVIVFGITALDAIAAAPSEYDVKAAYLYNFPKFVELPGDDILTLCIVGDDPFGDAINALQGSITAGKRLVVKRVSSADVISACQILFISSSEQGNLEAIMKYVRKKQILTIGDTKGYPYQGVIINFYMENNKVRIEINIDAAEQSKLRISSKLLNLARIIHDAQ
jgi:hypothetical protein